MTRAQTVALKYHCRLAAETRNPRFHAILPSEQVSWRCICAAVSHAPSRKVLAMRWTSATTRKKWPGG